MDSKTKIVQYLNEAHASEVGLVRVLQSQIAMTPRGDYRDALERHLRETREHAGKLETRMRELDGGDSPVQAVVGVAETVIAQALALGKTPIDLLRGSGGEEKVLKNAKDAAATEALEIATYTAIERLATGVGDDRTAKLAMSIRADEQRMLDRILALIPALTDAVAAADLRGEGTYKVAQDRRGRRRALDRPQGRAHDAPEREVGRPRTRAHRAGRRARRGRREGRGRPRAGSPDRRATTR